MVSAVEGSDVGHENYGRHMDAADVGHIMKLMHDRVHAVVLHYTGWR